MANVERNDVVYDLGSGDGRVVIAAVRDFGADRAIGVEIDPERVEESRANARAAGIADRVEFVQGDLFTDDLHDATVVTLFLGHDPNVRLRPRLFRLLQPGTRVVSHQFGMGEWRTDKSLTVRTVYFDVGREVESLPGQSPTSGLHGERDALRKQRHRLDVDRSRPGRRCLAREDRDRRRTSGTDRDPPPAAVGRERYFPPVWPDDSGRDNQSRPLGRPPAICPRAEHPRGVEFRRSRQRELPARKLAFADGGEIRESEWEAQREPSDLTGTWEWPCLAGARAVALRVDRRDGIHSAAYIDLDVSTPITDFYDHGGGFYFTLLIGRQANSSLVVTEDTGWLLGEGVLDDGTLTGAIEFHPYGDAPGGREGRQPARPVMQDWAPERVESSKPSK